MSPKNDRSWFDSHFMAVRHEQRRTNDITRSSSRRISGGRKRFVKKTTCNLGDTQCKR